jgi:DNA repair protein RecN (Recombination protein N)
VLSALSIRDVVLIEAIDLDFTEGLGVLTGEAGAGKSILLDALGLALGARADAGLVRAGASQAQVIASFELPAGHSALALLTESEIAVEPGEPLVVRRLLRADGGSRAHVNDQPISVGLLRELGERLVEIHGQQDDNGLLNPGGHRALLDAFAGVEPLRRAVAAAWERWRAAIAAHDALAAELAAAERDREWLEHAAGELQAVAPEEGEEEALAAERVAMQQGARLAEDFATIDALFDGSGGVLAQLRQAARRLERLAGEHERLAAALAAVDRALIEASDAEDGLAAAAAAMRSDPARLESVETRLFDLRALARKHRTSVDKLPALAAELGARMAQINAGAEGLAESEAAVAAARIAYRNAAAALSAARQAAAGRLDKAVATELPPLKLEAARFRTAVTTIDEAGWGSAGVDRVEFEIAANRGAAYAPLARTASGGELSRFLLALKVVLSAAGDITTIIFDEIDRGVGGAVASAVGERLARLAAQGQLLAVTHSPQVAARARHHWLIAKDPDAAVTRTSVHQLSPAERREEIARMLSGSEVTDEARAQADRLLEAA